MKDITKICIAIFSGIIVGDVLSTILKVLIWGI